MYDISIFRRGIQEYLAELIQSRGLPCHVCKYIASHHCNSIITITTTAIIIFITTIIEIAGKPMSSPPSMEVSMSSLQVSLHQCNALFANIFSIINNNNLTKCYHINMLTIQLTNVLTRKTLQKQQHLSFTNCLVEGCQEIAKKGLAMLWQEINLLEIVTK